MDIASQNWELWTAVGGQRKFVWRHLDRQHILDMGMPELKTVKNNTVYWNCPTCDMQISALYYEIIAFSLYLSMQGPCYNMDGYNKTLAQILYCYFWKHDMISQINITKSITEGSNIFTIYLKYFINTCQGSLSNSINFDEGVKTKLTIGLTYI